MKQVWSTFLKTRVISLSCKLYQRLDEVPKVMTQMAKAGFKNPAEYFNTKDAMKYNECKFYYSLSKCFKPDMKYLSQEEQVKYQEGLDSLSNFNELYQFQNNLSAFYWDLHTLYLDIIKTNNTPNAWYRVEHLTPEFQKTLDDHINKYFELIKNMQDHPEWREKIRDECGYELHMIYNNLTYNDNFKQLFEKFDSHYFFK